MSRAVDALNKELKEHGYFDTANNIRLVDVMLGTLCRAAYPLSEAQERFRDLFKAVARWQKLIWTMGERFMFQGIRQIGGCNRERMDAQGAGPSHGYMA